MLGSHFEIRTARPEEASQAIALLRRQLESHDIALGDDALERSVRTLTERPELGRVLIAADADGQLAGVAVMTFLWTLEHGGPGAWLDELWVEPEQRRHGLGRRLTEAALEVARQHGAVALDLEVETGHDAAERLYEKMGFERHRRVRWVRRLR
ncbi:MAG TPA: GNAT family N-acetyltransferase [Candidatus Binatia bacterium]